MVIWVKLELRTIVNGGNFFDLYTTLRIVNQTKAPRAVDSITESSSAHLVDYTIII